ncbi:MAG: hypothetical protein H0W64_10910 [Gammaproteobacteria bacterium]|nr:hypothetical protein [Gammaproteobacteria bacterium]
MSYFFNQLHQASCAVHDIIWDAQNWFADQFTSAVSNLESAWKNLAINGFNRHFTFNLLDNLLALISVGGTAGITTIATTVAIGLSLTIDLLKLPFFLTDQLFGGIYHGLHSGLSFIKNKTEVNDTSFKQQNNLQINPKLYQQDWYKIIEFARWAPSPHNMQPWVFDLQSEKQATLMYDPQRLLPNTNPNGSYVFVGFGILFETMSIAASKLGKDVEVELVENIALDPKKNGLQKLATLKMVNRNSSEAETLDPQLIIDRRTSRLPYNGKPVAATVINELSHVAKQYGHTMGHTSDYRMVDWVIELNAQAMHSDMSHGKTRNELRRWFRFSKSDAKKQADGLAAYAMNSSALALWLFANVNWMFRVPGITYLAHKSYLNSMAGTATVAWLSGPFNNVDDWLNAGRMMARWWLTMTKHDVYLHPFGSVITNPEAFKLFNDKVKDEHLDVRPKSNQQNPIWMLTRNGYSQTNEKPPQAQRIPTEKMIISRNNWCHLFGQKNLQLSHPEHPGSVAKTISVSCGKFISKA